MPTKEEITARLLKQRPPELGPAPEGQARFDEMMKARAAKQFKEQPVPFFQRQKRAADLFKEEDK